MEIRISCLIRVLRRRSRKLVRFIESRQRSDGCWLPNCWGSPYHPDRTNPVYGTSLILRSLWGAGRPCTETARLGVEWLVAHGNIDGGFGGDGGEPGGRGEHSTIEETSMAILALSGTRKDPQLWKCVTPVWERAVRWLVTTCECGEMWRASPIGRSTLKTLYSNELWPYLLTTEALAVVLSEESSSQRRACP